MQVVILAGGLGTRISEESGSRPKPMIEVGGRPVLWHLMHMYAWAGYNEFIVACGYRQEIIKDYFHAFYTQNSDLDIDLAKGSVSVIKSRASERWRLRLIDTGLSTMTGGRIRRLRDLIGNETFMCTYGDGLASIDVREVLALHRKEGRIATLTAVRPPARFGSLNLDGSKVVEFQEKPQASEGWINGGFFVFEPEIFDRIAGDETLLEHEPLVDLARDGELSCYLHDGFWQPMDTLRDKRLLEELWASGNAPWVH